MPGDDSATEGVVEDAGVIKFFRGTVAFVLLFAITFSTTNIFLSIIDAELPTVSINSLKVSNFNATKTSFTANWDANITVVNPDSLLRVSISELNILLTYGNSAISSVVVSEPRIKLGASKKVTMSVNIDKNRDKCFEGVALPFEEIVKARKNGTLAFKMYMMTTNNVMSGTWWERVMTMYYTCDSLKLRFESERNGTVMFKFGRSCYIGKL